MPPDVGRRERKRQLAVDHIAEVAWQMFEQQGFDQVTMEAIAVRADVAKGTLYKHFPVKEALLRPGFRAVLEQQWPAIQARLASLPTAIERLRMFLVGWGRSAQTYRGYLGPYLRFRFSEMAAPASGRSQRSGFDAVLRQLLLDCQREGAVRDDVPLPVLVEQLESLVLVAMLRCVADSDADMTVEVGWAFKLFTQGASLR